MFHTKYVSLIFARQTKKILFLILSFPKPSSVVGNPAKHSAKHHFPFVKIVKTLPEARFPTTEDGFGNELSGKTLFF